MLDFAAAPPRYLVILLSFRYSARGMSNEVQTGIWSSYLMLHRMVLQPQGSSQARDLGQRLTRIVVPCDKTGRRLFPSQLWDLTLSSKTHAHRGLDRDLHSPGREFLAIIEVEMSLAGCSTDKGGAGASVDHFLGPKQIAPSCLIPQIESSLS